ncbi:fibronectin type III domain-containing protein [Patescibacteria group bacterium]
MKSTQKKTKRQTKKQQQARCQAWLRMKEVAFIGLIGMVAALSMYTARDDHSAFGLLTPSQIAYAQQMPVITSFRSGVLVEEPFLELEMYPQPKGEQQVAATLLDPKNPPPVEKLEAYNTRVGDEVSLFWTRPASVLTVDIYRAEVDEEARPEELAAEELVAENVADLVYLDTTVKDDVAYQYRVVSVSQVDGIKYSATNSPAVEVTPSDEIPPQMPTNVLATSTANGASGLTITWTNPTEEDFDHVKIFRSAQYGERGEKIAEVSQAKPTQYLDSTVKANQVYYYSVVAYDTAGNGSSDAFQMPEVGNEYPFTPIETEDKTKKE